MFGGKCDAWSSAESRLRFVFNCFAMDIDTLKYTLSQRWCRLGRVLCLTSVGRAKLEGLRIVRPAG